MRQRVTDKWELLVIKARQLAERQNQAALIIQKSFRGYLTRRTLTIKLTAITVIQRAYKRHLIVNKWRNLVQLAKEQSANEQLQIKRDNCARLIQNWFKSSLETKRKRIEFRSLKSSVLVIEAFYLKAKLIKKWHQIVEQLLTEVRTRKTAAAVKLQSFWRGLLVRRAIGTKTKAASVIASAWRSYATRQREKRAAKRIQQWTRSQGFQAKVIQRRWSTILEEVNRPSELAIEELLSDQEIRATLVEQSRELAAVVIQRAWRLNKQRNKVANCKTFWPRRRLFDEKDRLIDEANIANDVKQAGVISGELISNEHERLIEELPFKTKLANSCFIKIKEMMSRAKKYDDKRRTLRSYSNAN